MVSVWIVYAQANTHEHGFTSVHICAKTHICICIQSVSRGTVNILGGHSIGHSIYIYMCVCTCVLFLTVSEIQLFHIIAHIKERHALRRASRLVLARVAKRIDVDGEIFENALY
jgi:hypothetical protein